MDYTSRNKGVRAIGSKGKCGGIVQVINSLLPAHKDAVYGEPFACMFKIGQHVRAATRLASDLDPYSICLHKANMQGWEPPRYCDEIQYAACKKLYKEGVVSPLVAFVGFACSFGGRFYEGYARAKNGDVNFAASARRSFLRQRPFLSGTRFRCCDYREFDEVYARWTPHILYLDPPYKGTKPCGSVRKKFDSGAFWKWAVKKARNSIVVVSEYACPVKHAVVVWEKSVAAGIRYGTGGDGGAKGSGKRKQERLFLLNPEVRTKIGMGIL